MQNNIVWNLSDLLFNLHVKVCCSIIPFVQSFSAESRQLNVSKAVTPFIVFNLRLIIFCRCALHQVACQWVVYVELQKIQMALLLKL